MGSALGPTLANAFLVHFEKTWLQNCPSEFKPHYYRRYVDDIFVFFTWPKHLETFRYFPNGRHANMWFTNISGVYTHFDSFLPSAYKFGTVYTLIDAFEFALVGLSYTLN